MSLAGTDSLNTRGIFAQGRIARAVMLGLGATPPDEIELVGNDDEVIGKLRSTLDQG